MKKVLMIAVACVCTILVIFLLSSYTGLFANLTSYEEMRVSNAALTDSSFSVDLSIEASSALTFRGYSYKIKGDRLNVYVRSGLVNKRFKDTKLSILIEDDLSGVKSVYLMEQGGETLLCSR